MATPIVVGNSYFTDFAGGQGIADVADYFGYADDLDTNFETLRARVNTVIAEVNGINGPNSLFGQDIMFGDDSTITSGTLNTGRIGVNPATVTINGSNAAQVDITAGAISLNAVRTDVFSQTVSGAGLGGGSVTPAYIAIDVNGIVSVAATSGTQTADIASVNWNGSVFTGAVTDLLETFLDGDEWYECRTEPANTPFVAGRYRGVHSRLDNFSRSLAGFTTNTAGQAIGATIIGGGSAASPRVGLGDGTGTIDANSGWYRSAASQLSFSTGSAERVRLSALGIGVQNGSAASPSIRLYGSTNLGFYHHASNEIGIAVSGAQAASIRAAQFRGANGSAATPYYSFFGATRDTSGMYSPAVNELAFSTNSTRALGIGSAGVVTLPLQPGGSASRAGTQSIPNATATAILLTDADLFDTANQHDPTTNSDRVTIAAGQQGIYQVNAQATFNESSGGGASATRLIEITVNGTARARALSNGDGTNSKGLTCSGVMSLAATDIVRVQVTQNSTGSMNVSNSRISWAKVA